MVDGGLMMNLQAIIEEGAFMVSGGNQLLECIPATSEQDPSEQVPAPRRGRDDDEDEEDRGKSNERRRPSDPLRTASLL
jgi:hypothetical protein